MNAYPLFTSSLLTRLVATARPAEPANDEGEYQPGGSKTHQPQRFPHA